MSTQYDLEKTAKELAIQAGFRIAYSAYNNDQLNYWIKKTLSYINDNLVRNGPTTITTIYDTKGTPIMGTVVKRSGGDLLVKGGSIGFTTLKGKTSLLDETQIEINKDSTAYIELTDMEGNNYKFSNLIFNRGPSGTTRMWRHNDSSRIINWIRSARIQDGILQGTDTVCGTLMSDDNNEFVICDALIISTALSYTGLSSS